MNKESKTLDEVIKKEINIEHINYKKNVENNIQEINDDKIDRKISKNIKNLKIETKNLKK